MTCTRSLKLASVRLLTSHLIALLALAALLVVFPFSGSTPPVPGSLAMPLEFDRLSLAFVPNAGQTDKAVRFQAHGMGSTIFFTPGELVLTLPEVTVDQRQVPYVEQRPWPVSDQRSSVLRLRFEDTNPTADVVGADCSPGVVNYLIGDDPTGWYTNLPTYKEIIYRELYPGIDLHYTGATGADSGSLSLKGTYFVVPGADPTSIRWRYDGAENVRLDRVTGDLLIEPPAASQIANHKSHLIERAPVAWQTVSGQRVAVSIQYVLAADGSIGFALGRYNPAYALTIDPTLTYSSYLGGSSFDYGWSVAVDADGNAYVTGRTSSTDFPTQNPVQPDIGGGPFGDAFVVKLNATGSALVYATYLGGSHNDISYDIAVDSDGNAYLTGDTLSADFPIKNAAQPTPGGGGPLEGDAFVVKLDPSGSGLVYATYLGGGGDELSYGIALDALNNAYVTGYTSSTDFPVVKAPQPAPAFGQGLNVDGDAFVTQMISATGVYTWGYSTYLGGVDLDIGRGITVDDSGNAYITGHTRSTDFPTAKPVQPAYGGGSSSGRGDAFVTQVISASGLYTWGYSTYLGGSGNDSGNGIAVDDSGDAYVTGETASSDFPTTNPFQTSYGGDQDAFVTKVISASGVYTWGYSTYLGGEGTDLGLDVAVDVSDNAYLTGYSFSTDFPTSDDAYDRTCGTDGLCNSSGGDVFFTKLNSAGDTLAYSTFLGGSSTDFGHGIAIDEAGNAYLTGYTYSADFPTTTAASDTTCGTDGQCNGFVADAFMAKVTTAPDLVVSKTADPPEGTPVTQGDTINYTVAATNSGAPATDVVITDAIPPGTAYVAGSVTSILGDASFDGTVVKVSVPTLTASAPLTVTFQVTVTTGLTTFISNKAVLTGGQMDPVDSNVVSHPARGTGEIHNVYLPMVFKGEGETLPECAPYLLADIRVGAEPRGIAIDQLRNRVYVANYGGDSLSVIDGYSNIVIRTITSITTANGVAYDPVHDLIWVTNYGRDQVTPIDAASLVALQPIEVGDGPWGVAYDQVHDYVYVVNSLEDSVSVLDAETRGVVTTLSEDFDQPFHAVANQMTGKVYVPNFGDHSVTVLNGISVAKVDLASTQPYGVTVDSHRVVVIGTDAEGIPDQVLGWAAFHRGFGDPARPVPLRAIAVNPDIGPAGDGGHLWVTTSTADGGEANQVLLIPKGWPGFHWPVPHELGTNPSEGIAVDRVRDRVYVSNGTTSGTVTVLGDNPETCLTTFAVGNAPLGFEVLTPR